MTEKENKEMTGINGWQIKSGRQIERGEGERETDSQTNRDRQTDR